VSETLRETMAGETIEAPAMPTTSQGGRPWGLWKSQVLAVIRLELRKSFLNRRVVGLLLLAMQPVFIMTMRAILPEAVDDPANLADATQGFSAAYQGFILRIVVFLGCVILFGNLIRQEVLNRSLHYYFLSPIRRELLVVAKYLTALTVALVLFGSSTLASYLLAYAPHAGVERFFLHGPGVGHLGAYLLVTALGCVGYGAVFLAFGFFFKSPAIPALLVFGWEGINFLLPPLLKKVSVIHYLQSLCPVPFDHGPLAILADAPSPWVAIPGVLLVSAALLALSAWKIRKMEISYEED
jgi:ABC-type transport system involved in multi-copper enzyme maturation permease subunit